MHSMSVFEIVKKLIGPTEPIGEHNEDMQRSRNISELCVLVDMLVGEIHNADILGRRQEASMKHIGNKARAYMKDLRAALEDWT